MNYYYSTSTTKRRIAQTPQNRCFFEKVVDLCSRRSNFLQLDFANLIYVGAVSQKKNLAPDVRKKLPKLSLLK